MGFVKSCKAKPLLKSGLRSKLQLGVMRSRRWALRNTSGCAAAPKSALPVRSYASEASHQQMASPSRKASQRRCSSDAAAWKHFSAAGSGSSGSVSEPRSGMVAGSCHLRGPRLLRSRKSSASGRGSLRRRGTLSLRGSRGWNPSPAKRPCITFESGSECRIQRAF